MHHSFSNLMLNSNLFTEFSLLFTFQRHSNFIKLDQVKINCNIMNPKKAHQPEIEMCENLKQLCMGYTLVIIKIRFENFTQYLYFPNLKTLKEVFYIQYITHVAQRLS